MNIFFTSDTHFGHRNIITFDETAFDSIEEYDKTLIERWNAVVGEEDIVYHLGDFAMGGDKERLRSYVERLHGRKRLILGNHDHGSPAFYYDLGFERVYDHPVILRNFFILSHEPLFLTPSMPYFNIFGHVHLHPAVRTHSPNSMCVCSCRHGFAPVRVEEWENYKPEDHRNLLSF